MKNNVYFGIMWRIVALFIVAMLATFLPEHLREFFGDLRYVEFNNMDDMDGWYKWGPRHYWYFVMMVALFILTLINFIISVVKLVQNNYDTKDWG